MTTNSPNPVDGDVQALDGKELKIAAEYWTNKAHCIASAGQIYGPVLSQLAEVALAALKEKPVSITDDMAFAFHSATTDSSIGAADVEEIKDGLRAAFANITTPPAQLLRPVELPKRKSMLTREEIDEDYTTCMAVPLDDVIAALDKAGVPYEVKS